MDDVDVVDTVSDAAAVGTGMARVNARERTRLAPSQGPQGLCVLGLGVVRADPLYVHQIPLARNVFIFRSVSATVQRRAAQRSSRQGPFNSPLFVILLPSPNGIASTFVYLDALGRAPGCCFEMEQWWVLVGCGWTGWVG